MKTIPPVLLAAILCFIGLPTMAQPKNQWKGRSAAVVLTYDDGLNVHIKNVLPALDSLNLKATFYISDYFNGLRSQIPAWKKAAARGHELGNHTIHHPCLGGTPERSWVSAESDMNRYTVARLVKEIKAMNTLLYAIDGKTQRTFAYPCGDTRLHDTAYIDSLKDEFPGARGVMAGTPSPTDVDPYYVTCYAVNGQSGRELISAVEDARKKGGLLVFLFHGVGGEHSLDVSLEAHRELLRYLKKNERDIWIAPLIDVIKFVKPISK